MANQGVIDFWLYSDNCSGQNRNKNILSVFLYASAKFNISIKHTFLEVGHTQNEGDSVYATIEKFAKNQKIYTPEDWIELIKRAKARL